MGVEYVFEPSHVLEFDTYYPVANIDESGNVTITMGIIRVKEQLYTFYSRQKSPIAPTQIIQKNNNASNSRKFSGVGDPLDRISGPSPLDKIICQEPLSRLTIEDLVQ
ncbi:MAG: hypothetical protein Q8R00_03045 [Candidatus Nanoarchaeia archaeon]|nr:hypothetical protein [Candidatus Nanoarchaeia archaeon]